MKKRQVLFPVILAMFVFGVGTSSLARTRWDSTACGGGTIQFSQDCRGNDRGWHVSCCPDGSSAAGVAYDDISGQDHADAVSVVCRDKSGNIEITDSDFSESPKKYTCGGKEKLIGIYVKDVVADDGEMRDSLDGVTAICAAPKSSREHRIANYDIKGGREGSELMVTDSKKIVGIAYKDRESGKSDRADCAALIVK